MNYFYCYHLAWAETIQNGKGHKIKPQKTQKEIIGETV